MYINSKDGSAVTYMADHLLDQPAHLQKQERDYGVCLKH